MSCHRIFLDRKENGGKDYAPYVFPVKAATSLGVRAYNGQRKTPWSCREENTQLAENAEDFCGLRGRC